MCILGETNLPKAGETTCYKVVSINNRGVKCPLFRMALNKTYDFAAQFYNEITTSVYDRYSNVRIQAFATERSAAIFYDGVNKLDFNIPEYVKYIELWRCTMLPPIYEGIWDMNLTMKLIAGHEIRFDERIAGRSI